MFTAFYITVALLQFSIGQESMKYESEIPQEVDTTPTPNENSDGDFIIEPMSVTVESNDNPMNDNTPVNDENYKDDIGEPIEPVYLFAEPVEQGQVTTATNYETEDDNGSTSSEEVPEVSEPISFNGCAKAQGKVTIAANFGCGESIGNAVTVTEIDSQSSNEVPDEPVSFEGPVHGKGKVVVGSHYGCGAPFGMPPVFFPWFPPIHGFTTHYPYPYPGPGFKFQNMANEPGNQDLSDLPVASNLGNSATDDINGIPFGGVVPASGTVSIAARF